MKLLGTLKFYIGTSFFDVKLSAVITLLNVACTWCGSYDRAWDQSSNINSNEVTSLTFHALFSSGGCQDYWQYSCTVFTTFHLFSKYYVRSPSLFLYESNGFFVAMCCLKPDTLETWFKALKLKAQKKFWIRQVKHMTSLAITRGRRKYIFRYIL